MATSDLILVDQLPSYTRVAFIREGRLDQIWIDDAHRDPYQPGAMVAVKISQAFHQHNRATVDLNGVKGSLRLPDRHMFKSGDIIPAMVTSAPRDDGFGAKPLQLKFAGHIKPDGQSSHGDVITPAPTALEDAQAHAPDVDVIYDDDGSVWADLQVDQMLEDAAASILDLPGGGRIALSTPPGAAVVDGDSAASQLAPFALAASIVPVVMQQLRLRRIGGPIVIDFPRLSPEEASKIHRAMQAEAKKDSLKPSLHGFTRGGLYTMARPWKGRLLQDEILPQPRALGLDVLRHIRRHLNRVGLGKANGGLKFRLPSIGLDWLNHDGKSDLNTLISSASFQVDFTADDDIVDVVQDT